MFPQQDPASGLRTNRRHFFGQSGHRGLGAIGASALATLLHENRLQAADAENTETEPRAKTHFEPRARRIIYLCQSGGPAQQDLFDYKPILNDQNGKELP
ncbi:MAG: sulfatase, partial [Planctomycetota bacterium]